MTVDPSQPMTCYRHPKTETVLRCSRCERPICVKCAIQTPTGYRCPECVHNQQKVFDTAKTTDFILSPLLAALITFLASWIIPRLGIITIFVSPLVAILIAEISRRLVQKRRSIRLFRVITAFAAIGSIPALVIQLAGLFLTLSSGNMTNMSVLVFLPIVWQGLFTVLVSTTLYYRLL